MQRTLVAIGCVLAVSAGSALAQQQQDHSSGGDLTEKARQAAQALGEKTRELAGKVKNKTDDQTAQSGKTAPSGPERMQKQADADYKSAKAQCEVKEGQQRTICEKEATAAHAQAEVQVEKAKAMGAGPSTSKSSSQASSSSSK